MLHVRAELNGAESAFLELEIRVVNSSTPGDANADTDEDEHAEDHAREQQLKEVEVNSGVAPAFGSDEGTNFIASGSLGNATDKQPTGRGNARQSAGIKWHSNSSSTSNGTSLLESNSSLATRAAVGNTSSSSDTAAGTDDTLRTTVKVLVAVVGAGGLAAAALVAAKLLLPKLAPCIMLLPSHAELDALI